MVRVTFKLYQIQGSASFTKIEFLFQNDLSNFSETCEF